MALSLNAARNAIITSIYGRRLGLDNLEFLAGALDIRRQVTDLTSATTGTVVPNNGTVTFNGTSLATSAAGGAFLLSNPVPGVSVTICNVNPLTSAGSPGSTAFTVLRPSTAFVIQSSEGTTETTVNIAAGCAATLTGLTTALYQLTNRVTLAGVVVNGTT